MDELERLLGSLVARLGSKELLFERRYTHLGYLQFTDGALRQLLSLFRECLPAILGELNNLGRLPNQIERALAGPLRDFGQLRLIFRGRLHLRPSLYWRRDGSPRLTGPESHFLCLTSC